MYKILDKVDSPADLRKLDMDQLKVLCSEIRDYIVTCCADNPGHLASSLGAVELIVGLHYVFDTPKDKLVFDVGHQAYAHKILTGRKEDFRRNRMAGGLSGFPNRDESPWDSFGVGHASTSVSAALGLVEAAKVAGRDEKVVALIGDGAMTGGLALEGLNNAGDTNADILVVLNDNEMAIDGNKGGIHSYLLKFITNPGYNKLKESVWDRLGRSGVRNWVQRMVRRTKSGLVTATGGELFEAFGLRYFGPVDGNDIAQVVETLRRLRGIKGPKLLHALTVKGKGYAPAEASPTTWHAPGKFDAATGRRLGGEGRATRYQDVFGQVLCDLAEKDPRVVGITPAMATGSGMSRFAAMFPDRFFDVGIAEEHAATFAAGLAAGGARPYCAIYSSFAQRAYDQIIHDVALQHLPVVFCFDRAGLVGEDGATHQGVFDLAAFRSIPNCVISAPRDESELARLLHSGLDAGSGPFIIRYPRGCGEGAPWKTAGTEKVPLGKGEKIVDGEVIAILALGPEACRAAEAAEAFRQRHGFSPAVYDMRFLKPVDTSILEEAMTSYKAVLTVEEGCLKGGLFSEACEYMAASGHSVPLHGLGVPDRFITQDSQPSQRAACSLDCKGILGELERIFKKS